MTRTFHARSNRPKRGKRCAHHTPKRGRGIVWHAERKALAEKGETMRQCPTCLRFLWPDEMGKPNQGATL